MRTSSRLDAWLILSAVLVYCLFYLANQSLPGNNISHPLGWWEWFDQGQYMLAVKAFAVGNLSPENHYYPPLYPYLGSLFFGFLPVHPFFFINLFAFVLFCLGFVVFARRYVSNGLACAILVVSVYCNKALMENFVIPWTTACTITAVATAVLVLSWIQRQSFCSRRTLLGFGLVLSLAFGALGLARPLDALLAGIFFPAYLLLAWCKQPDQAVSRRLVDIVLVALILLVGPLVSVGLFLRFNDVVFGSPFGGYFNATANASGYFLLEFPKKAMSLLVDSKSLYLEPRASLISHYPWLLLSLGGMVLALLRGDLLLRAVVLAVVVQFSLYIPYGDLLPNGVWRYLNIHYFKWTVPFLGLFAWLALQAILKPAIEGQWRKCVLHTAVILFVALLVSALRFSLAFETVPVVAQAGQRLTLALPSEPVDFIDLPATGDFNPVYFGEHQVWMDDKPLRKIRDFRLLPAPGGVRLLFNQTQPGGRLQLELDPRVAIPSSLTTVRAASYGFTLGSPRLRHD